MLRITSGKLVTVNTGFRANFQAGRIAAAAESTYQRIATVVPSNTREQEYGWLKDIDPDQYLNDVRGSYGA